jgi:hypothetical protein
VDEGGRAAARRGRTEGCLSDAKSGDRFGRWTLVRFGPHGSRRGGVRSRWTCRCICGHTQPVFLEDLQMGRSSGCSRPSCRSVHHGLTALAGVIPEAARMRLDSQCIVLRRGERVRVGQVFGRWLVKRQLHPQTEGLRPRPRALAECVCGRKRIVVERALKMGRSCGCGDPSCAASWEAWSRMWAVLRDPPPSIFGGPTGEERRPHVSEP